MVTFIIISPWNPSHFVNTRTRGKSGWRVWASKKTCYVLLFERRIGRNLRAGLTGGSSPAPRAPPIICSPGGTGTDGRPAITVTQALAAETTQRIRSARSISCPRQQNSATRKAKKSYINRSAVCHGAAVCGAREPRERRERPARAAAGVACGCFRPGAAAPARAW